MSGSGIHGKIQSQPAPLQSGASRIGTQSLVCTQSDPSGRDASVSEGDSPDKAANEFGVSEFEADLKQYAQQVH